MQPTPLQIHGTDVYVEGNGPSTIVMLHGWPDTHHLWDGMVAALSAQHPQRVARIVARQREAANSGLPALAGT